jgi:asparagine synthase (glutamine-hydrolysing)
MIAVQQHRGPDNQGIYVSDDNQIGLGHNRLSIIDLSSNAHQPMTDESGQLHIVFNGEIYNYLELRAELDDYSFQSSSDTEVILAAYQKWGRGCLCRFIGMFAFAIWDERSKELFVVRDRLGVKPLYYAYLPEGAMCVASEIKALHAAGIPRIPNAKTWSTYLTYGAYDHSPDTFWEGIRQLPAGHFLIWDQDGIDIERWYDLETEIMENGDDSRDLRSIQDEYLALLEESVRLRFRSDVPVAINISGGLDSSMLLGLVHRVQGKDNAVKAYTFITNDPAYDETPWVQQMLARTQHESVLCVLRVEDVPSLAQSVQILQDEPFGGMPTLAYAQVFETACSQGTVVLLDGQGMDEQWAGYDYYAKESTSSSIVQGSSDSPVRPESLYQSFRLLAERPQYPTPFNDFVLNTQYRDILHTKIPRALRFNDRISMRASTELREPFLDHRLFELALRQPFRYKIADGKHKWFLREVAKRYLPTQLVEAPKRPLQTPQREWLRGPLRHWAADLIETAVSGFPDWLDKSAVQAVWSKYLRGESDNSFYVWQWISLGMMKNAGMFI